jgi:vacuolar-type H+-ATPase subunit I/STV1
VLLPLERQRSLFDYKILASYLAGTTSGALLTALIVWLLSGFAEPLSVGPRIVLLLTGAVFIWLCKHSRLSSLIVLPESRRQIPAEVFGGSLSQGAFRFGLELGTGVRTYLPSAAPYILLLAVFLAQVTLSNAVLVGIGFGVGRAIPLAVQLLAVRRLREDTNPFLRRSDNFASATAALFILAGALILV